MRILYRRTRNQKVNRRHWAKLAERAADAVVLVNWEDIRGDDSWRSFDDIGLDTTVRMFTAGWIVAAHDDRLILASTRYYLLEQRSGGYSNAIPAGCIIKVTKWQVDDGG